MEHVNTGLSSLSLQLAHAGITDGARTEMEKGYHASHIWFHSSELRYARAAC